MLLNPRAVRTVATEIATAADGVIEEYGRGLFVEEPQITDRMLGAISDRLRRRSIAGIVWSAKTLRTGRGAAGEESRYGADFMGVFDVSLSTFVIKKGFLTQAKRAEPGHPLSTRDWSRLVGQCNRMLKITPDAFVVAYSVSRGICFIPAVEIQGSSETDLFAHYYRKIQSFFELFIECLIGDQKLHTANAKVLEELRDVHRVLELRARYDWDEQVEEKAD